MKRLIALFILASIALTCFSCGERVTFPDDLDRIEHIGEVPKEFKKVIETDQMRNARFGHGMAVVTYPRSNNGEADIAIFDYYGKKLGSFHIPADGYESSFRAYPAYDGSILVFRSPEEDTDGNRMSVMLKYDLKGNVIFRAEAGENIPIGGAYRIGSDYYSIGTQLSKTDPENLDDMCITKISESGDVKTVFIEGVSIYRPFSILSMCDQITPDGIKVRAEFNKNGENIFKLYEYNSNLELISVTDTDGKTGLPSYEGGEYVFDASECDFDIPLEIYEMGDLLNCVDYGDRVLIMVSRFTGQRPTDEPSTSYAYNYYETVYICYSKDGTLLWRTSRDRSKVKVA